MRKSKLKDTCVTVPERPNYENVADYLISKTITQGIGGKYTEDSLTQRVFVNDLVTKRELRKTEKRLEKKRDAAAKLRVTLDAEWEELFSKEVSFGQSFKRFHKFVKENSEKRERASDKVGDYRQLRKEKEAEIEELRKLIDQMKSTKAVMDKKISQYRIYENFIIRVLEDNPERFKYISDILNRYESLVTSKERLALHQEEAMVNLDRGKEEMKELVDKHSFMILGLTTKISHMNERHENAVRTSIHWEEIFNSIKDVLLFKLTEANEISNVAYEMYTHMCLAKKKKPDLNEDDMGGIFDFIKRTLLQIESVNRQVMRSRRTTQESITV